MPCNNSLPWRWHLPSSIVTITNGHSSSSTAVVSSPSVVSRLFSRRGLASDLGVAVLLAVRALDLAPIPGEGALLAVVALLLAVAASHSGHVSGLVTFFGHVSLLTTVSAGTAAALRAVLGEVSDFAALAAFDIGGVGRLLAVSDLVAGFAAVLASILVDARLGTVSDTMAICTTVVARDLRAVGAFHLLLGAKLGNVAKLLTVVAKRETSVNDLASIVQALEELLAGLGPPLNLPGTVGLFNKAVRHSVLLVDVALKVHVGEDLN